MLYPIENHKHTLLTFLQIPVGKRVSNNKIKYIHYGFKREADTQFTIHHWKAHKGTAHLSSALKPPQNKF